MSIQSKRAALQMIVDDMTNDVERDEGLPFSGENVARALGEIRAAVAALALIVQDGLEVPDGLER